MNRRAGVTLVELMVGMVMSAFLGTMMVNLLLTSTRFNDRVEAGREARGTARTPLNLITTELRMVNAETGVISADSVTITVRVPFMMGLVCSVTPGRLGFCYRGIPAGRCHDARRVARLYRLRDPAVRRLLRLFGLRFGHSDEPRRPRQPVRPAALPCRPVRSSAPCSDRSEALPRPERR